MFLCDGSQIPFPKPHSVWEWVWYPSGSVPLRNEQSYDRDSPICFFTVIRYSDTHWTLGVIVERIKRGLLDFVPSDWVYKSPLGSTVSTLFVRVIQILFELSHGSRWSLLIVVRKSQIFLLTLQHRLHFKGFKFYNRDINIISVSSSFDVVIRSRLKTKVTWYENFTNQDPE